MELDLYKVYELLKSHPEIEIRLGSDPVYGGLQIRVIDWEKLFQMHRIITAEMMLNMKGSIPIYKIVEEMVNQVIEGEDREDAD